MDLRANQMRTNAVVNYTGDIMLFSALITDITCNIDMTWFPYDVVGFLYAIVLAISPSIAAILSYNARFVDV